MSDYDEGIPADAEELPPFPILGTENNIGQKLTFGPADGMQPAECEIIAYRPPTRDVYFYKEIIPLDEAIETNKETGHRKFRHIEIKVRSEEYGAVTLFDDQPLWAKSGSKLPTWAGRLGADKLNHKFEDLLGKPCAVVVGVWAKRDDQGNIIKMGNNLVDVIGV